MRSPAATPSAVWVSSEASTGVASAARKTSVGMAGSRLAEAHGDLDELYRERRLQGHDHADLAGDLLGARGVDLQVEAGQRLRVDHAGQERVEGRAQRVADPLVVEPPDVGAGSRPHAVLGEVDDAADGDRGERRPLAGRGDAPHDAVAVLAHDGEDVAADQLGLLAAVEGA